MSFKYKILGGFMSLLAVVLGASLWVINRRETLRAEADIHAGLSSAQAVFQELLESRQRQLATSLSLLSGDFAFKQAVGSGDTATILSASSNHRNRIKADLLIVTDAEGLVLADTRGVLRAGKSLAPLSVVAKAIDQEAAADVVVLDDAVYQLAAAPMLAPDMIGVLVAGFAVDDRLAASLKRLSDAELSFIKKGKLFATTLDKRNAEALELSVGVLGARPELKLLAGERQILLAAPLAPEVVVVIQRSWDQALEPLRQMQRLLYFIALAGFPAAILLGWLIAGGVTSGLARLAAATVEIAKGRYDIDIQVRSRDEIGQLGESFTKMVQGLREREKIRSVLRKAVSKEIAEALLAKGQIELGGEERSVTVLFSDIRSFTSISEELPPKELVAQLNEYFIGMARSIETHHGVIDKFVGDAIMALFGAPLGSDQDAANAVRSALGMIAALETLNQTRSRNGLKPWHNGIGLNTGSVIAGTMGSEDRWSYTVIGDSVNLASRLEGLTKHYGVRLIVSEATRQAAGTAFNYRLLDHVVVKGRQEPVAIFEVLGEGKAPGWLADYSAGHAAAQRGDWDGAASCFGRVLEKQPEDAAAARFLSLIKECREDSRRAWDQPTRMTEK